MKILNVITVLKSGDWNLAIISAELHHGWEQEIGTRIAVLKFYDYTLVFLLMDDDKERDVEPLRNFPLDAFITIFNLEAITRAWRTFICQSLTHAYSSRYGNQLI